MQTIKEIRKYVNKERRREYEGYNNMLEYFRQFDIEQLNYLEVNAKVSLERKYLAMKENVTIILLSITLMVSIMSQALSENLNYAMTVLRYLTGLIIVVIFVFGIMELYQTIKKVNYNIILKIVKKIKKEKM